MVEILEALGELPQRVVTYEDETTSGSSWKQRLMDKEIEEWKSMSSMLQKVTEVHLVVAALIATVTFAACITMLRGFVSGEISHPGFALSSKSVAFKAFVIIDTISMVLSSSGINDEKHGMKLVVLAFILILGAMVAMRLTFVSGVYVVLVPSFDLAIANCIVGLTFFAILFTMSVILFASSFSQLFSFLN